MDFNLYKVRAGGSAPLLTHIDPSLVNDWNVFARQLCDFEGPVGGEELVNLDSSGFAHWHCKAYSADGSDNDFTLNAATAMALFAVKFHQQTPQKITVNDELISVESSLNGRYPSITLSGFASSRLHGVNQSSVIGALGDLPGSPEIRLVRRGGLHVLLYCHEELRPFSAAQLSGWELDLAVRCKIEAKVSQVIPLAGNQLFVQAAYPLDDDFETASLDAAVAVANVERARQETNEVVVFGRHDQVTIRSSPRSTSVLSHELTARGAPVYRGATTWDGKSLASAMRAVPDMGAFEEASKATSDTRHHLAESGVSITD